MKTLLLGVGYLSLCAIISASSTAQSPSSMYQPGTKVIHTGTQFSIELTPKSSAKLLQKSNDAHALCQDGETALRSRDYVSAEDDFRDSISADPGGSAYLGLAESLAGQKRTAEAIQAYEVLVHPNGKVFYGGSFMPRAYLEYSLLLNQTGRWAEAIEAYRSAMPNLSTGDLPKIVMSFEAESPQPDALAAAAHIALGYDANFERSGLDTYKNDSAFEEYTKALKLEPNWDIANYYYGFGWQQLSPKEKAVFLKAPQAKSALQKAVKIGTADVKKAAERALKDAG